MDQDFPRWLNEQLEERGWSRSEAARRGKISASALDKVIGGFSRPGLEFCQGIARAFKIPVEDVLRQAGILPMYGELPAQLRELMARVVVLPKTDQEMIVQALEALVSLAESRIQRGSEPR